jgi:N-acetylglutamate synthase-like GNAT family acetyltransferase
MATVKNVEIRRAAVKDLEIIGYIQCQLNRPPRSECNPEEYIIACYGDEAVGCAATSLYAEGAYFYGLAVMREWQRKGIGSLLMHARFSALDTQYTSYAVALVMFWNSRFFRKHGFIPVKRNGLPGSAFHHSDLTNPAYSRSATMLRRIGTGNKWA